MRVGLDGHTLGAGAGGNETYVRGLLEGLAALDDGCEVVVYVGPDGPGLDEFGPDGPGPDELGPDGPGPGVPGAGELGPDEPGPGEPRPKGPGGRVRCVSLRSSGPLRRLAWELPRRLSRDHVDVAHFQYVPPLLAPCPVVVSIHDPSFRLAPELLGWRLALRLRSTTRLALHSAAAVLVPSRWTRRTLASLYPGAADRLHRVPLGRSERFTHRRSPADADVRARVGLPDRYLLYVGRRQRRKNVEGLIESYRRAVAREPDLPPLALVGPPGPEDEGIRRRAARPAGGTRRPGGQDVAGRVLMLSDVGDEALPAVYRGAELFCYPARYEGFGLPVLEAMSCGVAVAAADEGALPELVGEAGLLLPPEEPRRWATAVVELHRDPEWRRDLGLRARRQAAGYSWSRTAERTRQHYEAATAAARG